MAPILQKQASKNVDAWFEKNAQLNMSAAQRKFPELMKVAHLRKEAAIKRVVTKAKGAPAVQASISGGSA
jgi:hypothetical protein